MAKRPDVQYIRYYTDGTAARKLEFAAPEKAHHTRPLPKIQKQKRRIVYIDPVAIFGAAVAVCMLVMMLVGVVQLKAAKRENLVMERYIAQLQLENTELSNQYAEGYDLADIESKALALGMVPADQMEHTAIDITEPADPQENISLWERVGTFLTRLFA